MCLLRICLLLLTPLFTLQSVSRNHDGGTLTDPTPHSFGARKHAKFPESRESDPFTDPVGRYGGMLLTAVSANHDGFQRMDHIYNGPRRTRGNQSTDHVCSVARCYPFQVAGGADRAQLLFLFFQHVSPRCLSLHHYTSPRVVLSKKDITADSEAAPNLYACTPSNGLPIYLVTNHANEFQMPQLLRPSRHLRAWRLVFCPGAH
jgi:hypothetical protein